MRLRRLRAIVLADDVTASNILESGRVVLHPGQAVCHSSARGRNLWDRQARQQRLVHHVSTARCSVKGFGARCLAPMATWIVGMSTASGAAFPRRCPGGRRRAGSRTATPAASTPVSGHRVDRRVFARAVISVVSELAAWQRRDAREQIRRKLVELPAVASCWRRGGLSLQQCPPGHGVSAVYRYVSSRDELLTCCSSDACRPGRWTRPATTPSPTRRRHPVALERCAVGQSLLPLGPRYTVADFWLSRAA